MGRILRVVRCWFGATVRSQARAMAAIVLLVGLVGGASLAAVAAARRTQSSYPAFLASTHPVDVSFPTGHYGLNGAKTGYDPDLIRKVAALPYVFGVESSVVINNEVVTASGRQVQPVARPPGNFEVQTSASITGLGFDEGRLAVVQGRIFDPERVGEMVMSESIARLLGLHLGQIVHIAVYTNAEEARPGPSGVEWRAHAHAIVPVLIVGFVVPSDSLVQDDVDAVAANVALFTPAFGRRFANCCASDTTTGVRLVHGRQDLPALTEALTRLNPEIGSRVRFGAADTAKAERAVAPASIALAVFGGIAAIATIAIAGLLVERQLQAEDTALASLRAFGAEPTITVAAGLVGLVAAIVAGTVVAGAVAIAVSPLAPVGPIRPVYPHLGVAADWTVLLAGGGALAVALLVVAVLLGIRAAPHRVAERARAAPRRTAVAERLLSATGLPVPLTYGVRFALVPGKGRAAAPVRSALAGAALALVVVVSTLTFGASLHTLVSRPALYGWNWDVELAGGGGVGAVPAKLAERELGHDPDVVAWAPAYFGTATIDGANVPVLAVRPGDDVHPAILQGRSITTVGEAVLGPSTLAQLHKHVGDTITMRAGTGSTFHLLIVGTASLPAVGGSGGGAAHLEMGSGAVVPYALVPPKLRNFSGNTPDGPNAIFVRYRPGVMAPAASRRITAIADRLSLTTNWGVTVLTAQRPAEIVTYGSLSTTPALLTLAVALGAVSALALTFVASVRRRRHDLALLKAFGLTRRQIRAVVAWQSTTSVLVGVIVGLPIGVVVGRVLWDRFASGIHAVSVPTVPIGWVALVVLGAVVLANLVAAIPGVLAARTPAAILLRDG